MTVLPMNGDAPIPDATILIEGDRVTAIGETASITEVPEGTRRINGAGKWVMPGLTDMHVHMMAELMHHAPEYDPDLEIAGGELAVVAYTGDDERFEYIYKFVSSRKVTEGDSPQARRENLRILSAGTLYVATFSSDAPVTVDGARRKGKTAPVKAAVDGFLDGALPRIKCGKAFRGPYKPAACVREKTGSGAARC